MASIEKTVFISYRRTDVYTALAVYENLKNQGYDVFFDYTSIPSGDFEQIITSNIKARAHFLVILTPTALDRCSEPGDWLRREIEVAIDEKRNIVPLFFKGFGFGNSSISEKLTGKLRNLSRYNGLNVHEDYFREAMQRLRKQFLNIPLDTVLHPVSIEVQKMVKVEQVAADEALRQREDLKEPVKQVEEKTTKSEVEPTPQSVEEESTPFVASQKQKKDEKQLEQKPNLENESPLRPIVRLAQVAKREVASYALGKVRPRGLIGVIGGGLVLIALSIWGFSNFIGDQSTTTPEPTRSSQLVVTQTPQPTATQSSQFIRTGTASPTDTPIPPTPTLGIGSTMISNKDGMTLLYIPAGEFTMGSDNGNADEKPPHKVYLNAFWIDKTEVTFEMYSLCIESGDCEELAAVIYFGGDSPVDSVTWYQATAYCTGAGRRLPTEAEWEKAARGTDQRIYPWGNNEPEPNLVQMNPYGSTTVGSFPGGASPFRALDMAGNLWEWVNDWYDENYYSDSPPSNPEGPTSGISRVIRGGSWDFSANNKLLRTTTRARQDPSTVWLRLGFRCAMSATP